MNTSGKEEYLLKVKNTMLLHFSHKDIHSTLDDLNQLFESGKENGKTEGEIYNEFGVPKEFTHDLLQDSHDKFTGNLFRYICSALILCVVTILAFCHHSQVLLCILTVIVPGFIWNLLGGSCQYKIRAESGKTLRRLSIYYILSCLIIVAEQVFVTLLNTNLDSMIPFGKAVYHLSFLLLIVAVIMLAIAVYRLYRGYYLSFGILVMSCGIIGSLFLYLDYLRNFDDAGGPYLLGFLPYLVSFVFSVICLLRMVLKTANSNGTGNCS